MNPVPLQPHEAGEPTARQLPSCVQDVWTARLATAAALLATVALILGAPLGQ